MGERACEHCSFWDRIDPKDDSVPILGWCRSIPPKVIPGEGEDCWPISSSNEWCGYFQPKTGFRGTLAMTIDFLREQGCPLESGAMNFAVVKEWLDGIRQHP